MLSVCVCVRVFGAGAGGYRFSALPLSSFASLQFLPLPQGAGGPATWAMVASCCNYFNETAVVATSKHYGMPHWTSVLMPPLTSAHPNLPSPLGIGGLLTPGVECGYDSKMGGIGEWGYEFQAFDFQHFGSSPCVNLTLPSLASAGIKPRTKIEALARMDTYYDCRLAAATSAPGADPTVLNLIGHYFYAGLGVQRGHTALVASEIQENINSIQAHYALTRGAARQYSLPWAIDVSPWDAGFITDYSVKRPWGAASAAGGDGGHSPSLFKRSWYLSYLSGANSLIVEAGGVSKCCSCLDD